MPRKIGPNYVFLENRCKMMLDMKPLVPEGFVKKGLYFDVMFDLAKEI